VIIDYSSHLISPRTIKELEAIRDRHGLGKMRFHFPLSNADLQFRISLLDKYEIDKQVISFSSPFLFGLDKGEAKRICSIANEDVAEFCRKRPDRFVGLGHLSLLDVDSALLELDKCVNELGLKGVMIATNENGMGIDSLQIEPVYQRISDYGIPIFLHPTDWESYQLVQNEMMWIFGWPFDTTQAIWRLMTRGVLDKFPELKIVTHHLGGMLPYFYGRAGGYLQAMGEDKWLRGKDEIWKQVYGDTALDGLLGALKCGYEFFGADRIVFGTDYPFGAESGEAFLRDNLTMIKKMSVSSDEKSKILSGNAKKLLKIQ